MATTIQPHPTIDVEPAGARTTSGAPEPVRLFDSFGMNPRMLRFFLLEKGMDIPRREMNILAAENRQPDYLRLNPAGQLPAVELSDGTILSEVPGICEYLEELKPEPALIGRTPEERAVTRMWWRRVEINICLPMVHGFYFAEGLELFRTRTRWIDGLIACEWLAGNRFTAADICLYCYVDQLRTAGQPIPDECANLKAWFERVDARPAAEQSIWKERPMGMRG